ncbi:hypothetical protein M3Y98_00182200 [Aphelenchoides besseyi]|nr:hypothetical protein M3Y98_00182200 [Aphelenchoides besseyi]KAI6200127.1 hypothetical protein M3Y96_00700100 [Aphelenchoides besseyi]
MFDNGAAMMSFGSTAPTTGGNSLQKAFIASCRNHVAPQPLGTTRRSTYGSDLSEQQIDIAYIWNNSPSMMNSIEDIWKFSPSTGFGNDLNAGSQSSSSPDEKNDPIFSLASQLTFNSNNFDDFTRPQQPMNNNYAASGMNKKNSQQNRQMSAREVTNDVKESLCIAFILQQSCEMGDNCLYAHSIMDIGKKTTGAHRTNSNSVLQHSDSAASVLGENSGYMPSISTTNNIWNNDYNSVNEFIRFLN